METITKILGGAILVVLTVAFAAFLSGTIIYFIWPFAIPIVFPGLVEAGSLAGELSWWASVCLTWIASILIKSSSSK